MFSLVANFSSASVLPNYFNREENEIYYLIGKERANGKWADFGGQKDLLDARPSKTAIRELNEELIGGLQLAEKNIRKNLARTFKLQVGNHIHYFTALNTINESSDSLQLDEVSKIRKNHKVNLQKPGLKNCQKEKTELAWIRASDLLAASSQTKGKIIFQNKFTLYKKPISSSGTIRDVEFRGCFLKNLAIMLAKLPKAESYILQGFEEVHGSQVKLGSKSS